MSTLQDQGVKDFIWATSWENLFMSYANNKGADQPAHPRSLVSTFIGNFMTLDTFFSWADRFGSYLVENPENSSFMANIWIWWNTWAGVIKGSVLFYCTCTWLLNPVVVQGLHVRYSACGWPSGLTLTQGLHVRCSACGWPSGLTSLKGYMWGVLLADDQVV